MIYLIAKIFVYLLLALAIGAAAGWLWRHQQAAAREAELDRQIMDFRSRLPQLETAQRAREQQIEGLLAEVHTRDEALEQQQALVAERDKAVAELERTCADLRTRLDGVQAPAAPAEQASETARDDELALHPGDPAAADAVERAGTESVASETATDGADETVSAAEAPSSAAPDAAPAVAPDLEREALEADLAEVRRSLEQARNALAAEQRRVAELTQERALQHRALAALEQQLEMVREDDQRAANG